MVTVEKLDELAPPIIRRKINWHKENLQNKTIKGCECGSIPFLNSFNKCQSCIYSMYNGDMRVGCITSDRANYNGVV